MTRTIHTPTHTIVQLEDPEAILALGCFRHAGGIPVFLAVYPDQHGLWTLGDLIASLERVVATLRMIDRVDRG